MSKSKPWFDGAVGFACTACGKCCLSRGQSRVFVNPKEIERISKQTKLSAETFTTNIKQSKSSMNGNSITNLVSLKGDPTGKQCMFLDTKNHCSIYESRPTQCRTYPYWPQNMIGQAEWLAESYDCEGISFIRGKNQETSSIRPASKSATGAIASTEIAMNMIIHQIHNQGIGENWTYNEAKELLEDAMLLQSDYIEEERRQNRESVREGVGNGITATSSEKESAGNGDTTSSVLLDTFLGEFYAANRSQIVYESELLRVVDAYVAIQPDINTTQDNSSPAQDVQVVPAVDDNGADTVAISGMHGIHGMDDAAIGHQRTSCGDSTVHVLRRLEFVHAPLLSQTEMRLTLASSSTTTTTITTSTTTNTTTSPSTSSSSSSSSFDDSPTTSCWEPDHSVLTLPVHQRIGEIVLQYLVKGKESNPSLNISDCGSSSSSSNDNFRQTAISNGVRRSKNSSLSSSCGFSDNDICSSTDSRSVDIFVIGAGGCALPAYLRTHLSTVSYNCSGTSTSNIFTRIDSAPSASGNFPPQVTIHAVEPEEEILAIAERFFGVEFEDGSDDADAFDNGSGGRDGLLNTIRIKKYVTDGVSFLTDIATNSRDTAGNDSVKVVIIDAYDAVSVSDMSTSDTAPPQEFLSAWSHIHLLFQGNMRLSDARMDDSVIDSGSRSSGSSGLLVINVYGTESWIQKVVASLKEAGSDYAEATGSCSSSRRWCEPTILEVEAPSAAGAAMKSHNVVRTNHNPADDCNSVNTPPSPRNVVLITTPIN
mmetsp:Transcript_14015/g.23336  ORF Transcript_14015/g.23336 Transcript_14015/m.23336 type:complete len:765 (-) Transcript_14015:26-2320(-)